MKEGFFRYLIGFLWIIICFLLQTTLFKHLALADVVPNLLLILTVSISYIRGQKPGMLCGFLCGLLMDMMYGDLLGINALIFMLLGFLNGFVNYIYEEEDFTFPVIITAVSDFLYNFLFYIISFSLRSRLGLGFYFRRIMLPELVYTLLLSVFLYRLIQKTMQLPAKKAEKEM